MIPAANDRAGSIDHQTNCSLPVNNSVFFNEVIIRIQLNVAACNSVAFWPAVPIHDYAINIKLLISVGEQLGNTVLSAIIPVLNDVVIAFRYLNRHVKGVVSNVLYG